MSEYNDAMYITELRERIEELEKDVRKEWLIGYNEDYRITDEQIAAAWKMANKTFNGSCSVIGRWLLRLLETFNIFRCEGCWDCADGGGPEDGPRCNGKGWIIK